MDSMMIKIFEMIYYNPGINQQRLAKEFDLSRNQIQYRIKKLNTVLQDNGLASIEKDDQRLFTTIDFKEKQSFLKSISSSIHLQSTERSHYLPLRLILQDKQTLSRLSYSFDVSKNTILADMKEVEKLLDEKGLKVTFDRQQGYQIVGDELRIRKLWSSLLKPEVEKEYGITLLKILLDIDTEFLETIQKKIEQLEEDLNLHFSEAKIDYLSLLIYLSIIRGKQGAILPPKRLEKYADMIDEGTLAIVKDLFEPFYSQVDKGIAEELQFITMNILSINIVKKFNFKENESLTKAIDETIENFERFSITEFENVDELRDMLYQHVIPASYRIRFGTPDKTSVTESIQEKYAHYYSIVKQSVAPLDKLLGVEFVEDELAYILIIFLSFLKEKPLASEKKQAVVVCMNGVSVSKLLLENLREVFPEIDFQGYLSLREFYEADPQVDIIFSTVAVDTSIPTFVIRQFLTNEEKNNLKRNVELRIFGNNGSAVNNVSDGNLTEELMEIIKSNAIVDDESSLQREINQVLGNYLGNHPMIESNYERNQKLSQLLPQNHIQIYDEPLDFAEAICQVAKPLLANGYIEERYVEKIIEDYDPEYPYFVIAPEVALPHAGPEDGVNKLGMSLLRLNTPITFSEELEVRLLVMVTPENKKSHLQAVTQLYTLVHDQQFLQQLFSAKYEREIYQLIQMNIKE